MQGDELADDGQAEARARGPRRRAGAALEGLEDLLAQARRHAGAAVGDLEPEPLARRAQRHAHTAAGGRVAQRIRDEVRDDGDELLLVDLGLEGVGSVERELLAAELGDAREPVEDLAHERDRIDGPGLQLEPSRVEPRDLEKLLHPLEEDVGVRADALDVLAARLLQPAGREQPPAEPEDDREGRLELVSEAQDELARRPGEFAGAHGQRPDLEIAALAVVVSGRRCPAAGARSFHPPDAPDFRAVLGWSNM